MVKKDKTRVPQELCWTSFWRKQLLLKSEIDSYLRTEAFVGLAEKVVAEKWQEFAVDY